MKIIKIGAIWCAECIVMNSVWGEIKSELTDLNLESFDIDDDLEIQVKYNIKDIPVYIFLNKENKEFLRLKGAQNKKELLNIIKSNINN